MIDAVSFLKPQWPVGLALLVLYLLVELARAKFGGDRDLPRRAGRRRWRSARSNDSTPPLERSDLLSGPLPYRERFSMFTPTEAAFYVTLQTALQGSELVVFPKVRLADAVYLSNRIANFWTFWNHVSQKHVDFLLCDRTSHRPRLVIELDDPSHDDPDCQQRDGDKDRVLAAAGLPILRPRCEKRYTPSELSALIREKLQQRARA